MRIHQADRKAPRLILRPPIFQPMDGLSRYVVIIVIAAWVRVIECIAVRPL